MTTPTPDLLARFSPDTPLAEIPWHKLPPDVQETCWRFLQQWWSELDMDEVIEVSGLFEMPLGAVLALHERQKQAKTGNRYSLITYMRIEPEDAEPMTYEEALAEKEQQELMQPDHIHRIEEIPHP